MPGFEGSHLEYDHHVERDVAVAMRDGTVLYLEYRYHYFRQTMRHGGASEYGIAFQYVVFMARVSKLALTDRAVGAQLDEMWGSLTNWIGESELEPGASPLALTPDYEQWFFDMLTTSDYGEYWISPGQAIEEFIDDRLPERLRPESGRLDSAHALSQRVPRSRDDGARRGL